MELNEMTVTISLEMLNTLVNAAKLGNALDESRIHNLEEQVKNLQKAKESNKDFISSLQGTIRKLTAELELKDEEIKALREKIWLMNPEVKTNSEYALQP